MITGMVRIRGKRVTLRPYSAGFNDRELEALYAWARDPEILGLSGGAVLDVPFQQFRALFEAQLPSRNSETEQLFAILDEGGTMIGRTGLFSVDTETRTAELGIVIGEKSYWGQGLGRDAIRALVRFAFDELGLERIVLRTFAANERAQRACVAAGFRPVRKLQRFTLEQGTHSEIEMEIRVNDELPAAYSR